MTDRKASDLAYRLAHRAELKARRQVYNSAHKAERKAYRDAHKAEINARNRAYNAAHEAERKAYRDAHRAERSASKRAWVKANPGWAIAQKRAWRKANPAAHAAHDKVGEAIEAGRLVRLPCSVCGATPAQGHHEDYSKPLVVIWLCVIHHKEAHAETRRQRRAEKQIVAAAKKTSNQ